MIEFETTGSENASWHILLAPGAGASCNSPFLNRIATALAQHGGCVHRFDFGYMRERIKTGKRRPPPRAEMLCGEYESAMAACLDVLPRASSLLIGGKSMGGRVATMVAARNPDLARCAGVVVLGYPFHPPGKPHIDRTAHLFAMNKPALIIQGTRDHFGTPAEVAAYRLPNTIALHWIEDGDHDLKPRRAAGTHTAAIEQAAAAVARFAGS